MSTNVNTKKPLSINSATGSIEKLDVLTAIQLVGKQDSEALNRLVSLNNAVRMHSNSLYLIAYNMQEIDDNKDYTLYGYKNTAEMLEAFYGYGKSSCSQMLSVSRAFLESSVNETGSKDIHSVFVDGNGNDFNFTCLYELLQRAEIMKYRKDELISFYRSLLDNGLVSYDSKQKDLRKIKEHVTELLNKGAKLSVESYKGLLEMKVQSTEQNNNENAVQSTEHNSNGNAVQSTEQNTNKNAVQSTEKKSNYDRFMIAYSTIIECISSAENEDEKTKMFDSLKSIIVTFCGNEIQSTEQTADEQITKKKK